MLVGINLGGFSSAWEVRQLATPRMRDKIAEISRQQDTILIAYILSVKLL